MKKQELLKSLKRKEKYNMKKKIKDLTLEEIEKICKNHNCHFCPLDVNELWCKSDDLEHYGEQEIEVEEDDTH